jgi:hypothetical protein
MANAARRLDEEGGEEEGLQGLCVISLSMLRVATGEKSRQQIT